MAQQDARRRATARALVIFVFVASLFVGQPVQAAGLDYAVAGGHFYTQANGQGGAGGLGFVISDADGIPFWSEFQRRGGVQALGYPISHRFQWRGTVVQAMQKVVLQWLPDQQQVAFVNVFDELRVAGKDAWLWQVRSTPANAWLPDEASLSWPEVVRQRQAFLDPFPALKARYFAVPDPLTLYGLPASQVVDVGPAYVIRLQRAVLQQWKVDTAWAATGQVTVANGGDVAKEAGVFAADYITPRTADGSAGPTYAAYSLPWPGYDISYPQRNGPYPSSPSYKFGVVGVNGGKPFVPNSYFAAEYAYVKANTGTPPMLYMNLSYLDSATASAGSSGPAGTCASTDNACRSYNYGYNAAAYAYSYATNSASAAAVNTTWWLDIETANLWSPDTSLNVRVIRGALDFLQAKKLTIGIYSIQAMWTTITGNYKFGSAVPDWVAGAPSLAAAPGYCTSGYSFSGGPVRLVQGWNGTYDEDYACPGAF